MTAHRVLADIFEANKCIADPGDAGTIVVDRWGAFVRIVTTGVQTRIVAQPTSAGQLLGVGLKTDGGTCTVTVTGGYDQAGTTEFALADVGDFVVLYSVSSGSSYYWRVLNSEGVALELIDLDLDTLTVDTLATLASAAIATGNMPIQTSTTLAAEHGAGAIGTAMAPITTRRTVNGTIITEIKVDLTGLGCVGTAAKDAIGLVAGGAAIIGRYVVATCGVVYRVEMLCLEAPGEGTATITADIDLGAEDDGDVEYDGPVDDVVINTGGIAAGNLFVNNVPALTANDYLYLVEGDTTAATGVYNAGQVIVRLYGHALLA